MKHNGRHFMNVSFTQRVQGNGNRNVSGFSGWAKTGKHVSKILREGGTNDYSEFRNIAHIVIM